MTLYRMYRGVDFRDVVQAHALALQINKGFKLYVISGPVKFQNSDVPNFTAKQPSILILNAVTTFDMLARDNAVNSLFRFSMRPSNE